MIRKLNRVIQDYLRPKRLAIGRMLWDKKTTEESDLIEGGKLIMDKVKSILFLRYDGKIGDMVINTLMFKEIKNRYPNIKIGVVARGAAKDIIKYNTSIDIIYDYEKGKERELAEKIASKEYDVLVDFSELLRVNQMKFINLCKAKVNIGLNKEDWKLFDLSYKKDRDAHITNLYERVLKILKIEDIIPQYDINIPTESLERVEKIIEGCKRVVTFNPYAASKHRSLNKENIVKVTEKLLRTEGTTVFIIGEKDRKEEIEKIIDEIKGDVRYPELKGILDVAALISKSDYVVTPDTSIVHIAAAFKIPMTAIYRADSIEDTNSKIWAPNYPQGHQIFSIAKEKKVGEETDINLFNVEEIEC